MSALLPPPRGDVLADKFHVTVILRLLLCRQGRLEHGEVVDVNGTSHGRFKDWRGLSRVVRSWVATQDLQKPRESSGEDRG